MSTRPTTPRGWLLAATAAAATAIVLLPAGAAFAAPAPNGATAAFGTAASAPAAASASLPADVEAATAELAATPWVTTGAVDQNGDAVALDDPRAANFVGNAYFHADGTYAMYQLDDSPKLHGSWDMRLVDGALSRWITSENAAGEVQWERVVEIVDLDDAYFTYRVVDPADASKWVDIVHEPTSHLEPGTEQAAVEAATAALAATPWVTTGAVDQNGDAVALDDPRAANFVGNAYFHADGTFDMFTLGTDAPKMHGNWDMRVIDGRLSRWIQALNADGSVAFERTVEIVRLDAGVFTYRVPGENGTHTDIVHEPTDYSVTAAATAELAATPWVTTGAVDQNGDAVALDDPRAANFVGNAYFRADGTFSMYQLDDAPKMHGNWDMRIVDGRLSRWIQALNADGSVAFERTVEIVRLDAGVFTYRVPGENGAFVDIVHEPTDHAEPGTEEPGNGNGSNGNGNAGNGNAGNGNNGANGNGNAGNSNTGNGNASNGANGNGGGPDGPGKGRGNPGHPGAPGQQLAVTGSSASVAGIAGGIAALIGGGTLLGVPLMRRTIG